MKTNRKKTLTEPNTLVKLFLLCFLLGSCDKSSEEINIPNVGDVMEGGVVLHVFKSTDEGYVEGEAHGIIVSQADLVIESQWGCQGTAIGGTSTSVGKGRSNTEAVIAFHDNLPDYYNNPTQCHESNDGTVAANAARTYSNDGYTDWFLPSSKEASILYENRAVIGGYEEAEYWSSCESNANKACVVSFATGELLSANKSELKKVRVIRYF